MKQLAKKDFVAEHVEIVLRSPRQHRSGLPVITIPKLQPPAAALARVQAQSIDGGMERLWLWSYHAPEMVQLLRKEGYELKELRRG